MLQVAVEKVLSKETPVDALGSYLSAMAAIRLTLLVRQNNNWRRRW